MWNVKAEVIPVITGGNWNHFKIIQYLSNVPGKHEIKELQTTAIFGTAHKLLKVLMWMYKTYLIGEITLHVAQTVTTEQLQRCEAQRHVF